MTNSRATVSWKWLNSDQVIGGNPYLVSPGNHNPASFLKEFRSVLLGLLEICNNIFSSFHYPALGDTCPSLAVSLELVGVDLRLSSIC